MKNIFLAAWLAFVSAAFVQAQTPESLQDTIHTDKPDPCKGDEIISPLFPGCMKSKVSIVFSAKAGDICHK